MGPPVESSGVGGCGSLDVGSLLQDSGTGGPTLWVGDMGDVPTHQEDAGRISPPGDTPNDGAADKTEFQ